MVFWNNNYKDLLMYITQYDQIIDPDILDQLILIKDPSTDWSVKRVSISNLANLIGVSETTLYKAIIEAGGYVKKRFCQRLLNNSGIICLN